MCKLARAGIASQLVSFRDPTLPWGNGLVTTECVQYLHGVALFHGLFNIELLLSTTKHNQMK